jgi:uncharacterized protein YqgC (DUF456 family)
MFAECVTFKEALGRVAMAALIGLVIGFFASLGAGLIVGLVAGGPITALVAGIGFALLMNIALSSVKEDLLPGDPAHSCGCTQSATGE